MKKLLIISVVWPEPKSTAAGQRLLQLIEVFNTNDYQITFACTGKKNAKSFNLERLNVLEVPIKLNDSNFDNFIRQLQPDIVMFDRFITEEQFGWRVFEHCPNALRILDTEDLHFLRKGREFAIKEDKPFDNDYLFNDLAKRELASIYRCDLSLIISEVEMSILKQKFNVAEAILHYIPFLIDEISEKVQDALPKFEERQHFISIGNFLHKPNFSAVLHLKKHIWSLIRKHLPKAELYIYGAYATQKVNKLHDEKVGFLVKGFAKDVGVVMQNARVCLAPLQFGAGLKGKLFDAMQNGTPCVMSSIAAEGMFDDCHAERSRSISCINEFVTNNPKAFAQKAVQLYTDKTLWKAKHQNGFSVLNTRFNKRFHEENFIKTVLKLQNKLEEHRQNNFTGQMLWHKSLQASKYMNKWIEEKNRNKVE